MFFQQQSTARFSIHPSTQHNTTSTGNIQSETSLIHIIKTCTPRTPANNSRNKSTQHQSSFTMAKKRTTDATAGGSPTENPYSDRPSPSPSKKKYTKRSPNSVQNAPAGGDDPNRVLISVTKTMSDDMLLTITKRNNAVPYVYPVVDHINRNPDLKRNMLHIEDIRYRVSPTDPTEHYMIRSANGFSRRFYICVGTTDSNSAQLNNAVNRRAWAEQFVTFYNHPATQRRFTYPNHAVFAGDITPERDEDLPQMSQFLTIKDTMEIIRLLLSDNPNQLMETADILNNDDIMNDYYAPNHRQLAREEFGNAANGANNNQGGQDGAANEYGDMEPFQFQR